MAFEQLGAEHHLSRRLHWTKLLVMSCWYFNLILPSLTSFMTVWSSTKMSQVDPGHSAGNVNNVRPINDCKQTFLFTYALAGALVNDLGCQILGPAGRTVEMAAF